MTDTNTDNVTNIETKRPQPTAKFSISASLDGFPIVIEGEGRAGDLKIIVDRLKAIGAQPPSLNGSKIEPTNEDAPVCEFHGAMKRSNHGGWFCPKRMGNGEYCKSKA